MPFTLTKEEDSQCRAIYTVLTTALSHRPRLLGGVLSWREPEVFPWDPPGERARGHFVLKGKYVSTEALVYDVKEMGIIAAAAPARLVGHALRLIAKQQGGKS